MKRFEFMLDRLQLTLNRVDYALKALQEYQLFVSAIFSLVKQVLVCTETSVLKFGKWFNSFLKKKV